MFPTADGADVCCAAKKGKNAGGMAAFSGIYYVDTEDIPTGGQNNGRGNILVREFARYLVTCGRENSGDYRAEIERCVHAMG